MSALTIDGALGEGGGQVLRTSLGLSVLTGRPLILENIRAGRPKPGLMRQHLTAVQAAARIGGARVEGATLGSTRLVFEPSSLIPGHHEFAIGTAGSATLVLQTVLPALLCAGAPSTLRIKGGTHNPAAPPFEFLEQAFLPTLRKMGVGIDARLLSYGFFPAGGGEVEVHLTPAKRLQGLGLLERGEPIARQATALISRLPSQVAGRELAQVKKRLGWTGEALKVQEVSSPGPGNALSLKLEYECVCEVITAFGRHGRPAEQVADEAIDAARDYLKTEPPVGVHLADQLIIPFALAKEGTFATVPPSRHTLTQVEIVRRFLDTPIELLEVGHRLWQFRVG